MTPAQRLHTTGRLREILETAGQLFEDVANESDPKALLHVANQLHERTGYVLEALTELARQANELPFVGANVEVGVETDDKGAQATMAAELNARADRREAERTRGAA